MDVHAYLRRIGCEPASPTAAFLQKMIECHLQTVPFENLDFYQNPRELSLDPEVLYEKVVTRRRGGVCFELNGLFLWLLQNLGYDCYPVSVRVLIIPGKEAPISHQGNIARVDGRKYYCDVGFGGPGPKGLVDLETEDIQTIAGEQFLVRRENLGYTILRKHGDDFSPILGFADLPVAQSDFPILLYYFTTHPQSHFVNHRVLNLSLPNGSLALTDDQLTRRENGTATTVTVSPEELDRVIREEFGIAQP